MTHITPAAREAAQDEINWKDTHQEPKEQGHYVQLAINEAVRPLVEAVNVLYGGCERYPYCEKKFLHAPDCKLRKLLSQFNQPHEGGDELCPHQVPKSQQSSEHRGSPAPKAAEQQQQPVGATKTAQQWASKINDDNKLMTCAKENPKMVIYSGFHSEVLVEQIEDVQQDARKGSVPVSELKKMLHGEDGYTFQELVSRLQTLIQNAKENGK